MGDLYTSKVRFDYSLGDLILHFDKCYIIGYTNPDKDGVYGFTNFCPGVSLLVVSNSDKTAFYLNEDTKIEFDVWKKEVTKEVYEYEDNDRNSYGVYINITIPGKTFISKIIPIYNQVKDLSKKQEWIKSIFPNTGYLYHDEKDFLERIVKYFPRFAPTEVAKEAELYDTTHRILTYMPPEYIEPYMK